MDHVTGGQAEARGDLGFSRLAAAKACANFGELGTSSTVDGAADATAGCQHLVGGIDDGIDIEPGDVAFDDLDAVGHRVIGPPNDPGIKPSRNRRDRDPGSRKMTEGESPCRLEGRRCVMLYHRV